jgi:hypothetical protein
VSFVSNLGNVFGGKSRDKEGEKPSEKPYEEREAKPVCFHCEYCRRDGHKDEFLIVS